MARRRAANPVTRRPGPADALSVRNGRLYVEEYNSRYVGGEDGAGAPRVARVSRVPTGGQRRRRDRRETGTVGVALAAILLVTALVIAAWRFGGHEWQGRFHFSAADSGRSSSVALCGR